MRCSPLLTPDRAGVYSGLVTRADKLLSIARGLAPEAKNIVEVEVPETGDAKVRANVAKMDGQETAFIVYAQSDADAERAEGLLSGVVGRAFVVRELGAEPASKGLEARTFRRLVPCGKGEEETPEQRFVLGVVLEPNDGKNGAPLNPDTQDQVYSAAAVEQAAWGFLARLNNGAHTCLMHAKDAGGDKVDYSGRIVCVESHVTRVDMEFPSGIVRKGTWLMGLRFDDLGLWQAVKAGELNGLSIGGTAWVEPAEPEAEAA